MQKSSLDAKLQKITFELGELKFRWASRTSVHSNPGHHENPIQNVLQRCLVASSQASLHRWSDWKSLHATGTVQCDLNCTSETAAIRREVFTSNRAKSHPLTRHQNSFLLPVALTL